MTNKIEMLSPKIEIINHFDSLINRIDIDIDEYLGKYNQDQVISKLNCFDIRKRNVKDQITIYLNWHSEKYIQYETVDEWPESTKVVDYLTRIRMRTIEELRKAQNETLDYYKQNSSQFKLNSMDEIRSELFKDKFHFQVLYKPEFASPWIFNLYTFETDFYISSTDIKLLEELINSPKDEAPDYKPFLDEKTVLIGLLQKHFFDNLITQKFPSHVIIVRKEDLLNIKEIECFNLKGVNLSASETIGLSNVEKINLVEINQTPDLQIEIVIEGFPSLDFLKLRFHSINHVIISNLFALRRFELNLGTTINSEILFKFIENSPYIEILDLNGDLSYFNLDSLFNLKRLDLYGEITDDFNVHLFDNLCNQLEYISISCSNFDDKYLEKLFYGRNFPYLTTFYLDNSSANISLEKKLFDGLRMLKKLKISHSKHVRIIDADVFSNLIQLEELHLSNTRIDKSLFANLINLKILTLYNNGIESIEENCFSNLHNLENLVLCSNRLKSLSAKSFVGLDNLKRLNLSYNELVNFDLDIFDNIGKFVEIYLYENPIINKDEILKRSLQSKIKVYFS